MKPLPIVLAVFAAAVLAAVAWLLNEPTPVSEADALRLDRGAPIVASRETGETVNVAPVPAPRSSLDAEQTAVLATSEAPVVGMPESYRAALGGVVGRVIEENGDPVPNLAIELLGGGVADILPPLDALVRGGPTEMQIELGHTLTDANGRFAFRELEPRILGVLLLDPGGPRALPHLLDESPVSGNERDLGDIVLPGSVTLVGRVIDERNEPISDVRVRATDLQPLILASGVADWRPGGAVLVDADEGGQGFQMVVEVPPSLARLERLLPFPTTHTDADGRFELPGVRPGLVSLVIDDSLHLTRVEGPLPTGEAGSVRDVGDLAVLDGLSLRGRVVDDQDEPVPFAEVMAGNVMPVAPVAILHPPVRADAEGRFEVRGLREGAVRAVARAAAHHTFTPDGGGAQAGGEVTVRLPGRRTLTLALRDEQQQPVTEARVFARRLPMEAASEVPDFVMSPKARGEEQGLTVDEQGRLLVGDLDPGIWDVLVAAEGFGPVRAQHDLTLADVTAEIALKPSHGLEVKVVRAADDEPVEWALVSARNLDRDQDGPPQPVTAGRTDAAGRVTLVDLEDARYALEVAHPAFAVKVTEVQLPVPETPDGQPGSPDGLSAEVTVALSRGGTVRGTVLENGSPPARVLMLALTREDDVKSSAVLPRMTLTLPDGTFAYHDVDPGKVRIEARERFEFAGLATWWEPFAMTALAEEHLVVEEDGELETVLVVGSTWADVPTAFVEGRLSVNGFPAAGWKVRTWSKIRRSVTTGPDGRFTLGQIASGEVTLTLSAPGKSMSDGVVDAYQCTLLEGDRHFATIELDTGSVSGRIWSRIDGRPVEGAQVVLEPLEKTGDRGWFGRQSGVVASNAEGEFHFDIVGEGRYIVRAEAKGFATARSDAIEVSGLRPTRGIELHLSAPVTVKGRVVFEDVDETPTWAWLNATTPNGDRAGASVDVETGTFVFDDLMPDRNWSVGCYTNTDEDLQPIEMFVTGDRDDVLLVFRPKAPEPEVEVELSEAEAAQLKQLGYVDTDDGGR